MMNFVQLFIIIRISTPDSQGLALGPRLLDKSQPKDEKSFFIIIRIGSGQTNGKQRCAIRIFHEGME